jgi:acetyl-CoA synthetase
VLGLPIHDNWWQTETGGIMIANTPAMDIKPGSMGKPLPGVEAAIVRGARRWRQVIDTPDTEGRAGAARGWPSMFRGYLDEDERYRRSASSAAGTSPATWRGATPTATTGSSAAPTTSSSRPAT